MANVKTDKKIKKMTPPDTVRLTERQAKRLSALSGVDARELGELTIASISEKYRWTIDPELLLFRRVCGQVVKKDPVSGIDYPVPFATVHVEDTDCSFLGFFPLENPWAWLFPIHCHREEIATVTTDACGNFCVWIPRFEIDWILRWRLERVCFPDIFINPSIRDILDHLRPLERPPIIRHPWPDPDPGPYLDDSVLQRAEHFLGRKTTDTLVAAAHATVLNGKMQPLNSVLDKPASLAIAPPLPEKLRQLFNSFETDGRNALANHVGANIDRVTSFDLAHYIGPFPRWHCHNVINSEIIPILDVPDITFRVTQDVNGDGVEETIYSEGYFDVRWNAGAIPGVTLHASEIAVATLTCNPMPNPECDELGNGLGIASVGFMPLKPVAPTAPLGNDYFDPLEGYARRLNRPHLNALIRTSTPLDQAASTPFEGTLLLRGCNQAKNAAFYRVHYSFNDGPAVPFLNHSWPIFRPLGSIPIWISPDTNGWYPVISDPGNWMIPYLLMAWPTGQSGIYDVFIELGDSSKNHLHNSEPVKFRIDNNSPSAMFTGLAWRIAQSGTQPCSDSSWTPLPLNCPVVRRPVGQNIEICVSYQVSATHLLYASLGAGGCGSPSSVLSRKTPLDTVAHWHTWHGDNNVSRSAIFQLNYAIDNQGAYVFSANAWSRAFNPSDAAGYTADWNNFDMARIGGNLANLQVAVVNL